MNYPTSEHSQLIWREITEMLFSNAYGDVTVEWIDPLYYAYPVNDIAELFAAAVDDDVLEKAMRREDQDGGDSLETFVEPYIATAIDAPMDVPKEEARVFIFMMLLRYPTSNVLSLSYDEMREMMTLALSAPLLPWETLRATKENDIDMALANAL